MSVLVLVPVSVLLVGGIVIYFFKNATVLTPSYAVPYFH